MLQESAVTLSSAVVAPLRKPGSSSEPDLQAELKLIKKLHRLSRISWSPTLRAHTEALKRRALELQRATTTKKDRSKQRGAM